MEIELLAKRMRERAIRIELEESSGRARQRSKSLPKPVYQTVEQRIEEIKKTYFHAGRWSGGSKDHAARVAFLKMQEIENAAN